MLNCDLKNRLLVRMIHLGIGMACFAAHVGAFDTPEKQLPRLPTSHGQIPFGATAQQATRGSIDILVAGNPISDEEMKEVYRERGANLVHIATAVTAAVPCYNVQGLPTPLKFSPETLAGIFLGRIKRWDDPAITALNPSLRLPAANIVVIGHDHRTEARMR